MNFMGRKLGTIDGKPFFANRVLTPLYPSVRRVENSPHLRFVLICQHGRFLSPYIRHRTVEGNKVKLRCDPIKLDHFLELVGVLVIDYKNQVICAPADFTLPWEASAGDEIAFEWSVPCVVTP